MDTERLGAFEWLRAGAALSVVLLHAGVPYLTHPMPGLAWPVRDAESRVVNGLFWSIELFIMPLFFLMAGYFAIRLLTRYGPVGFVRHRARKLLFPLVAFGAVILPLDLYSWLLGWVVEGHIDFRKMQSLKFADGQDDDLWGLSHLWFLQYLFLYCVVLAVVWHAWPRGLQTLKARYLIRRSSGYALLALGAASLLVAPKVAFGFQHGFVPFASKWIYSGTFFAGGVWLAIYDSRTRQVQRLAWRMGWIAIVSGTAAIVAGLEHLSGESSWVVRCLLAAATTVAAWTITLALVGGSLAWAPEPPRTVRYIAAASFWIYLVHHPLIGLVHTDLKVLLPETSPTLKMALSWSVTLAWCLASFEAFVRRSFLGRWLGVPQPRTASSSGQEQPPAAAESPRRAA